MIEAVATTFPVLPGAADSSGNGGAAIALSGSGNSIYNEGVIRGGDAGSATAQAGAGILMSTDSITNEIVNLGRISGGAGLNSYGIVNGGRLARLINAQGGSTSSSTPLTFYGQLPQNYDIVVSSATVYGQLAVGSALSTQKMTVGVSTAYGASLASGAFGNVIVGVSADDITNEKVVFSVTSGVLAAISNSAGSAMTNWDLRILNFGVDMAEPQRMLLDQTAFALRSSLDENDCDVFDEKGVCLSATARYRSLDGSGAGAQQYGNTSATLAIARRFSPNLRAGAFVEVGNHGDMDRNIDVTNSVPMVGGFAVWDGGGDGTGLQAKISAALKSENVSLKRINLIGSALTAQADADLDTWGVRGTLGWGYRVSDQLTLIPYLGVSTTDATRSGYAEQAQSGVVDAAFRYDSYSSKQTTTLAGVQLRGTLNARFGYHAGVELENDDSYKLNLFGVSGDFGSATYQSVLKQEKTRMTTSAGISYQAAPKMMISLEGVAREFMYGSADDYAVLFSIRIGL